MTTSLLRALKARFQQRSHPQKGFTLIELLIVTIIAGGIVSGLMFLVVELLTADQRDASRNATQQDIKRSMEYMSAELRDAVYVYSGELLNGLRDHIPANLNTATSTPVLAFWKQTPLPPNVIGYCADNRNSVDANRDPVPTQDAGGQPIPCAAGHAYSLVVYSLNTTPSAIWSENARITRYELRPYNYRPGRAAPERVGGYVSPVLGPRNLFEVWPFDLPVGDADRIDRQGVTRPTGEAVPLTDFVDRIESDEAPSCPSDEYKISPSDEDGEVLPLNSFPYSFYACVYTGNEAPGIPPDPDEEAETQPIANQEVVLYLRGNGFGRPSITSPEEGSSSFRPSLSTRVFNRGTLDINPSE